MDGDGPTLERIARAAGVSKATASKALAAVPGRYRIGAATAARIREAAGRLGWRRPSASRKGRVALVYGDHLPLLDGINADLHCALVGHLIENGLEVVYQSMDRGSRDGRRRALERVDGCIFIMRLPNRRRQWDGWLEEMRHFPPAVLVNAGLDLPHPQVEPDDAAGARTVLAHLLRQGHRRLALCGPLRIRDQHPAHALRHRTLLAAAGEEAGVALLDLCDRPWCEVAAALAPEDGVSALITLSGWDFPALGGHLLRHRLDWPGRLAVAACDDPRCLEQSDPPVTGVAWSMDQLVAEAFRLLDRAIAGDHAPTRVLIPTRLAERASTAPPRP